MIEVAWRMFVAETVHREGRQSTGMAVERGRGTGKEVEGEEGRTETTGTGEMTEVVTIETETGKILL